MSARTRRGVVAWRFKVAPSFARCDGCGAALAGLRAWLWTEHGVLHAACRSCVFPRDPRTAAATLGALS